MRRHEWQKLLFRLQVKFGLTPTEFRGLLILSGLLALGVLVREFSLRIPAVDPSVYQELEREFEERMRRFPPGELIGPEPMPPAPVEPPPATGGLNLNTASAAELESLPRIGPQLAQRILQHRQRFGPFRSADDLMMVRGIGDATLERLRPLVAVVPPDSAG